MVCCFIRYRESVKQSPVEKRGASKYLVPMYLLHICALLGPNCYSFRINIQGKTGWVPIYFI